MEEKKQESLAKPNLLFRRARLSHHLTQRQLASELRVSYDSVRSWEMGRRQKPDPENLRLVCDYFQMTAAELGFEAPEEITSSNKISMTPHMEANRHRMLKRVYATWIEGVLTQSQRQATWITLELQDQPDALVNPWRLEVQETNLPPRPLDPDTSIVQVYQESAGELLILGQPGAGKTTLLLELTHALLNIAEQDESQPIPVVFHLSSWATKQFALQEWLVEELRSKYEVPKSTAEQWVQNKQLSLLLDGLDEVAEGARQACVNALRKFQQEYALVPLVICCRSVEYFALSSRMALQRAVVIQPLTREQIDSYLSRAGRKLRALQQALRDDTELLEMVQSPLMLSIVSMAYQGEQSSSIFTGAKEERRQQIFHMYVQRMLARRGADSRYSQQQILHWLAWLAKQMQEHNQTEFYLERMQPDWLPDNMSRQYRLAVVRLVFTFAIAVYAGLFALFRGDSFPNSPGLFFWVGGGKGSTVLGWMAQGLGSGLQGAGSLGILFTIVTILVTVLAQRREIPTLTLPDLGRGLLSGLRHGIPIGGLISVFSALVFSRVGGLTYGLFRGVGIGLFAGLIVLLTSGLISVLREPTSPTQNNTWTLLDRLGSAALFGMCATVSFAGVFALQSGGITNLAISFGLVDGLFHAILFGLGNGTELIRGLGIDIRPAETVAWSWQAAYQSFPKNLKKGTLLGLSILVSVVVAIACISGSFYGIDYGLRYALIYGLIVGLIATVASILTGVLASGWSSDILDDKRQLSRPNEGIRRSRKNALFAASVFGSIGGLASGLISAFAFAHGGIAGWPVLGTGLTIIFGLIFAFHFFIHYGGIAVIEHYTLRWYLWRKGVMPRKYVAFLDYATERILLRKVGGGYIFIHRLLLDFFASMR